jgi:hypothetical protein
MSYVNAQKPLKCPKAVTSLEDVENIANFRSGVISSLCLNIFFIYLPGSGKCQDWVYLSSEQGVFNELGFKSVIMSSFEPA